MTYLDQKLSISLEESAATLTSDWFAHKNNPLSPPRPAGNVVTPLVCGEEAFGKVYECIQKATKSIDLISWGFDPGLRLNRASADSLSLGELLKQKADQGVEVRVLIWNNRAAQFVENSVIGEGWSGEGGTSAGSGLTAGKPADTSAREVKRQKLLRKQQEEQVRLEKLSANDESGRRTSRNRLIDIQKSLDDLDSGYTKGSDSGGTVQDPNEQVKTRDWHRWVHSREARNIEFRTRDFEFLGQLTYDDQNGLRMHWGRLAILWRMLKDESHDVPFMQMLVLSLFPSHHQKTLVIDYMDPQKAEGFVMGHNLQRNYWDTTAHAYDDEAGKRDQGFGPWQDLSLHVLGPVLFDLNHNFCNAWDKSSSWIRRVFKGTLNHERSSVKPLSLIRDGGEPAQICRTQPEEGPEKTILEVYEKALGNVHQYAYIENQYFRYKPLAERLKKVAADYVAAGKQQDLHLFVVTNNPESGHYSSSTYEMLDTLGQGELMPLAHRDLLYDQRQLAYRQRELKARDESPTRDQELAKVQTQMNEQGIDSSHTDELLAMDPNKHYNQAAARELEPELLPPKGLKIIIATLVSCKDGGETATAKTREQRQTERDITEHLGPEQGMAQYKSIYVHSKLLLVDDLFFTLGSANINERSLNSDSELNIAMPSPQTTRTWRERLWGMHSGKGVSKKTPFLIDNIQDDYEKWDAIITKNWENQKKKLPLNGNLVRFWDVVTPYAKALD
ncbi:MULTISPECIES: phospholipase D-like domain-containing protein [Pseudomonas]|uniref:Phospholipase D/transphosphatidylase n=1 Tax=Pseudomonas chlororaphis TaxID=587753 RepID=A0AAX3FY06_9PSED|nr:MULTISPECIES: phospholipase D-like domain-containing protein [Pseudomonas]PMY47091.1 phospholipase [Pseudomonas sp. FW306-2-2C-D06C]AZC40798.1 Cardiolipin synthetase [Pseudomonas chlororaphis subsp. piscium]AZC47356.1 Cardiolipin synthetase [Pseudomonas chlororaphis subsp. piscium]AZC54038.1 Cardiolipin synthetase [Pseudomonas chlororaphis subsp. piscium]AZC60367.1 Cardiolipin synthetase [Pseudomonas chlororaphis subsp. piscium]